MKLFNHTKIDNKILERVLYRAAKAVGSIRTGGVVILVKTSSRHLSGRVKRTYGFLYRGWLEGWGRNSKYWGYDSDLEIFTWFGKAAQAVYTDGGYMILKIPVYNAASSSYCDPLDFAKFIYEYAAHEWRHVRDMQKKEHFGKYNRNWKNRPHERRACNSAKKAVKEVDRRSDIQDAIIDLAVEIERLRGE